MRRSSVILIAFSLGGCAIDAPQPTGTPSHTPSATIRDDRRNDPWESVHDELVVSEEFPEYDYPKDLYMTPAAPDQRLTGRWAVDFEGSIFQDGTTGQTWTTTGVDDLLMDFVSVGKSYYDWDGCLEVEIIGAVADYPTPFPWGGEWLIVREVFSAERVPNRKVGEQCLDWSQLQEFINRE